MRQYISNEKYELIKDNLDSKDTYVVVDGENVEKVAFRTNNITGQNATYEIIPGTAPTGTMFNINADKINGINVDSNGVINISFSQDPANIDSISINNVLVDAVSFDTTNVTVSNEVVTQSGDNVLISPESGQNYFIVEKDDSEGTGIWTIKINDQDFITIVL